MYNAGDKVTIEIEAITTENVCRFATDNGKPTKLFKLKGMPMYFSEDDFKKIVGDLKQPHGTRTILYPDCDLITDTQEYDDCSECYRYEICKTAKGNSNLK